MTGPLRRQGKKTPRRLNKYPGKRGCNVITANAITAAQKDSGVLGEMNGKKRDGRIESSLAA